MSDQWQRIADIGDGREIELSTVELPVAHGDYTFESCVFWDDGSYVLRRYETKRAAKDGHNELATTIRNGEYEITDAEIANFEVQE